MLQLYEDYIPMNGKKPVGKISEITHYNDPSEIPDTHDGYGGRLKNGIVMVDIDDGDEAEVLLKIIQDSGIRTIIRETTRGYHFYFKNTNISRSTGPTKCVLGLTIEIKRHGKLSYEPIKINGKIRQIILKNEELDEIPYFLRLLKAAPAFRDLKDGRNQAFANYQYLLAEHNIEYEEGKKIGSIINDYVLHEPLPAREFDTVWRKEFYPEVKPVFFTDKGTFLHHIFADYMIEKYHIVSINGKLHVYNNGVYESEFETSTIELKMIDEIPMIKDRQRKEVLSYMKLKTINAELAPPNYILVKNGIFDIVNNTLSPFDHNLVFINKINYDYHADTRNQLVETTLDKISCYDEELYFLLREIVGYCLYRKNTFRVCPILVGNGSNGKSSYLKMIQNLLGDSNVSSLSLSDIQSTFRPAEIAGKLANLGDDINNNYIKDTSDIKKLITGETIIVEHKGKRAFKLNSYAKLVFTTNDLSNVSDKSKGWSSRIQVVPFTASFSKSDPDYDRNIDTKLESDECMEHLLSIAIESLQDVLEKDAFTDSKVVNKMTHEYEFQNNSLLQFFDEIDDLDDYIIGNVRKEIMLKYKVFCIENDIEHPLSNIKLSQLLKEWGYETGSGRERKYQLIPK